MLPPLLVIPAGLWIAYKAFSHSTNVNDLGATAPSPFVGPPAPPPNQSQMLMRQPGLQITRAMPGLSLGAHSLLNTKIFGGVPANPAQAAIAAAQQHPGAMLPGVPAGVLPAISAAASFIPPSAVQSAGSALGSVFSGWGSSGSSPSTEPVDTAGEATPMPDASSSDGSTAGMFSNYDDSGESYA